MNFAIRSSEWYRAFCAAGRLCCLLIHQGVHLFEGVEIRWHFIIFWVNEGLMAIFFFSRLELKREFFEGSCLVSKSPCRLRGTYVGSSTYLCLVVIASNMHAWAILLRQILLLRSVFYLFLVTYPLSLNYFFGTRSYG